MLATHASSKTTWTAGQRPVVLHTRVVTDTGGGPDKTILNSPRFLDESGYRGLCAYMHPPHDPGFESLRQRAIDARTQLLTVPDRGPLDWRVVRRLLQLCRREKVAIWHGHDYKSNALGLLLRRLHPMRLVTTVHGWGVHSGRTPLYYRIDKYCLRRYDRVVCVSPDLFEECIASGVPAERCVLIENAIDLEQYRRCHSPGQAKQQLGIDASRFVIGAVGRLSAEKGFDRLIQSFASIVSQGLDAELLIVGEGDERPHLEQLIASLPCADRIRLLGYRGDVPELLQAMDLFALSSLREGLPNVLLEAMALEVPVVATRIAGIPRLIAHRQNGLLVDADDVAGLTRAMHELLEDAPFRQKLAVSARTTIEQRYSFAVRMQKIRQVYDQLLQEKQR